MSFDMPRLRIVNVAKGPGVVAGRCTKIYIDDVDVTRCFNFVQVTSGIKGAVEATLGAYVNQVEFEAHMPTQVTPETRDMLVHLGWTPPPSAIDEQPLAEWETELLTQQGPGPRP